MNSAEAYLKVAIGTAQFGLNYGITNTRGQVPFSEASAILDAAKQHGIDTLDTAVAYGESEKVLGEVGVPTWKIISKLPPIPIGTIDVATWVNEQVTGSLHRLKVNRLHAVLLHKPLQLLDQQGQALFAALEGLRSSGLTEKIGISIYETAELDQLMPQMQFDIVQAPFNVLDRRIFESGWATRLLGMGCELHVRSIFLQGLLLTHAAYRPKQFSKWQTVWSTWDAWLKDAGISALEACLRYPLAMPEISKVVFGIESAVQLEQVLGAAVGPLPDMPDALRSDDAALLNPALWEKT